MSGEKTFPRGGKRIQSDTVSKDEDLFQTVPAPKRKKSATKVKAKHVLPPSDVTRAKSTKVDSLTFQTLREGLLVLGRVKEVQDLKVMVSLPHGLLGTLPITAVSQVYTRRLQAVADDDNDDADTQDVPSLKDLYRVGDGLQCRITAVTSKGDKRFVELSCDPKVINKDLPVAVLKSGCLLYGAIESMQEHGCVMDVGIPGITAFLTTSEAPEQDMERSEGQGVWCTVCSQNSLDVMSGETRVLRVTAHDVLEAEVTPHMVTSVDCVRPGMKIRATVVKVLKEGLYVQCTSYRGCVHSTHVPQRRQYKRGQEVEGRVLFIHPVSKIISLSLLPGILGCLQAEEEPFDGLTVGDFVEEAEVLFVNETNAIFRLSESCTALAPLRHLSDGQIKDVNQAFPQGSKHRCRVIGFQPADDVVLVSLKESIMKQKILSIKDLEPGQIVEGKVEATCASGVIVMLGKGLTGLIPKMHVADVPLKNFDKKFAKGDKLKCRVLKVDVAARKVYLTKKKSLVTTSRDVPTSFVGLTPGMQLEGFVIVVKQAGVAVGFCNDVKGWVPRHELSSVDIADPETVFYQGQVVRCRVLSCQPNERKLRLSLIISGKAAIASKSVKMDGFEAGKLLEAKVSKKLGRNLEVELQPSGVKALLPREHLSDSAENQLLLWQALEPGDCLGTVMLLKQTNLPIVTLKESFLSAARERLIPQSVKDLQPGQLLPGVIKNHQSYGMFVELPGGLGGLAPRKLTMDRPVIDLSRVFICGQSVVVKVIEVKEDKGRFLCSVRMCDCYHDDPKVSIEMLETYLNERDTYLDSMLDHKAEGVTMGSLLTVRVKERTKDGYICETSFGMPAVITQLHTAEVELSVGSEVEAVVLHIAVDQSDCCLEMSADRSLVRAVSRRKEKATMDKARQGQTIKGEVVLIKDDFVLVALKQHAVGTMALLPRRQHLNDVLAHATTNLVIGEETKVTIQKCDGDRVLAILASLAKEMKEHPRHVLQLGQMVSAKVHSVLPGQLNIKIGNVNARVHVTEVVDHMENGIFPFGKYTKGQEVMVKIIGFRHFKSFKYLPISHSGINKALPECSLKPSKLQKEECPHEDQASFIHHYEPGDKVPVYVTKFENSKLWVTVNTTQMGVLSVFDLSRDLGFLRHAERHFTAGHGYLATVLGVEDGGLLHLSLTGQKEMVKKNQIVTGKVSSVSDKGVALRLPGAFRGMVHSDTEHSATWRNVSVGSFIRCLVLSCKDKDNCVLTFNMTHRSEEELKRAQCPQNMRKRSRSESESSPSKRRRRSRSQSQEMAPVTTPQEQTTEESTMQCLSVASGFHWDQEPEAPADSGVDSEEDDDEDEDQRAKKKKQTEGGHDDSEDTVNYPMLLASRPNDSRLWIQYMVHHLNQGKVDTARTVANTALSTIAIEEEQEKLNMWMALLNLENMYGTKEEVNKTLHRALQLTDPLKLYRRVHAMYTANCNMEEAEQIHRILTRKYKQDRQVWIDYGLFLFKSGQQDAARKLLQRSLLSVDRKDHVTTITQFASMECKHGEAERGFTMFDKVLAEFPKRLDVMAVYTDMVIMKGDMDRARELFERSWSVKPSSRLFKKYVEFEKKYGTEESLARLEARVENATL